METLTVRRSTDTMGGIGGERRNTIMGIKETLQESLVEANNEKFRCHDLVQVYEGQLVDLKQILKRAEAKKASADIAHQTHRAKHDELLLYCNSLVEQGARNALLPDIERLVNEVNASVRDLQFAGEVVRQRQKELERAQTMAAAANASLLAATDRWEQIRKQIDDLNNQQIAK
jgi:hypothetical protein